MTTMGPTIYYSPHKNHIPEAAFFKAMIAHFPSATVVKHRFPLEPKCLNSVVDTKKLIDWLKEDVLLPSSKNRQCIEWLKRCPAELRVATSARRVSFDVVLVQDGKPHYWEFHEQQHRRMTVNRPAMVFTPDGSPLCVPRYVQRLVRDVWRTLFFRPYNVVWWDYFADNFDIFGFPLGIGFREYINPGNFSFGEFCQLP